MIKSILFIIPPCLNYDNFTNPENNARFIIKNNKAFGNTVADMPLGVLSLSAYIKKFYPIKVKLIDFNILLNKLEEFNYRSFEEYFEDELIKEIDFNPDIIGVSVLFNQSYQSMLDIGKISKEIFTNSYIFAGGTLPTNIYETIFNNSNCFNALCYGEGEKPLLNFIEAENKIEYLEKSTSWITRNKIKNKENNYLFDFIDNLDEIPFYDYDILNASDYSINPSIGIYSIGDKRKNFHVMTSRGCNFRCKFCSAYTVHGRKLRYFSFDRVREDFIRLKTLYNAHTLVFQDDNFLRDKDRALKIINLLNELDIKGMFENGLALHALTKDILLALKKAGVNQLSLPIESGSERVLKKLVGKHLSHKIIERVVDDCRELDIYIDAFILIGIPGETKKDIEDSINFLKSIDVNWYRIFVATPLVGSDLYKICVENNYVKESFLNGHFKKAIIETEDFTSEWISNKQYDMNLELNFVNNSDMRLEKYDRALIGFENAICAKQDHALALYYASICYRKLKQKEKAIEYLNKTKEIILNSIFWKNYFNDMDIKISE